MGIKLKYIIESMSCLLAFQFLGEINTPHMWLNPYLVIFINTLEKGSWSEIKEHNDLSQNASIRWREKMEL